MVDEHGTARIGDFGLIQFVQHTDLGSHSAHAGFGTYQWAAPETLAVPDEAAPMPRFTTAVDVYSFGMVLWEVRRAAPPSRPAARTLTPVRRRRAARGQCCSLVRGRGRRSRVKR